MKYITPLLYLFACLLTSACETAGCRKEESRTLNYALTIRPAKRKPARNLRDNVRITFVKWSKENGASFRLENNGKEPILIPGWFRDGSAPTAPRADAREFLENGRWYEVGFVEHGFLYSNRVDPGARLTWAEGLTGFGDLKAGTVVRIRLFNYYSTPFRWKGVEK